jgi:hypothetical protein
MDLVRVSGQVVEPRVRQCARLHNRGCGVEAG